jgi:hypothetical protein
MREYLMTGTFPLGSAGVFVTFDAAKFTRALSDSMTHEFVERCERETTNLADAKATDEAAREIDRQICARELACDSGGILKTWGLSGVMATPTHATLLKLPPKFPSELFKWTRKTALPHAAKNPADVWEPDARLNYMQLLVEPGMPTAAPHPRVEEYDVANFLRVNVEDLPDVPEFRIADARNILAARRAAAVTLANKLKAAKVIVISPEMFIGY